MTDQKSGKDDSNGPSPTDQIQDIFGKLQPIMEKLVVIGTKLAPHVCAAQKTGSLVWQKIEPYYKQYWKAEYIKVFIGFVLLFFGGMYAMTIACYMAIQISGLETIKKSWKIIKKNYNEGMEAFKNDESAQKFFDVDGDGCISCTEIAQAIKMLVSGTRKQKKAVLLNLRCVFIAIDPQQVMTGIGGLWATAIAVIATLRSTFAKDIALGISIGQIVSKQIGKYAKPIVQKRFDDDMKKWADFLIDYCCRLFGIALALMLVRVVSAFHSAVKGGQMIAKFVFDFLNPHQLGGGDVHVEGTTAFMAVQYGLAAFGFWWQLSSGFTLNSWIIRLILIPFTCTEVMLTYLAIY